MITGRTISHRYRTYPLHCHACFTDLRFGDTIYSRKGLAKYERDYLIDGLLTIPKNGYIRANYREEQANTNSPIDEILLAAI